MNQKLSNISEQWNRNCFAEYLMGFSLFYTARNLMHFLYSLLRIWHLNWQELCFWAVLPKQFPFCRDHFKIGGIVGFRAIYTLSQKLSESSYNKRASPRWRSRCNCIDVWFLDQISMPKCQTQTVVSAPARTSSVFMQRFRILLAQCVHCTVLQPSRASFVIRVFGQI